MTSEFYRFQERKPSFRCVLYFFVLALQGELFSAVKSHIEDGSTIYWAGDFNNHIANAFGITNNDGDVSKGGQNLIQFVQEENLEVLNNRDSTHTHVDKKHGTSSILDLVITNHGHTVTDFKVDSEIKMTPYRLIKVKGGHRRRFSDHIGIMWKAKLIKENRKTNKIVTWNMNKKFGNEKYLQLTNEMAMEVFAKVESCNDVEEIYGFILSKIYKSSSCITR